MENPVCEYIVSIQNEFWDRMLSKTLNGRILFCILSQLFFYLENRFLLIPITIFNEP